MQVAQKEEPTGGVLDFLCSSKRCEGGKYTMNPLCYVWFALQVLGLAYGIGNVFRELKSEESKTDVGVNCLLLLAQLLWGAFLLYLAHDYCVNCNAGTGFGLSFLLQVCMLALQIAVGAGYATGR
jgi:hypothetical protein